MRPLVQVDPESGSITIDGIEVYISVLAAIFSSPARVLWKFELVDGVLKATPYDERQVIWLEEKS